MDTTVVDEPQKTPGGRSNVKYIENRLKDRSFKNCKTFTHTDDEFTRGVKNMLALGTMAKRTAQLIKKELERTIDPHETPNILRKNIRSVAVENSSSKKAIQKREVILSGYLIK